MNANHPAPSASASSTGRRTFLGQATVAAAGLAALTGSAAATEQGAKPAPLLPTIRLGPHAVTRLIVGGNPVYGHAHFNKLLSQHQTSWHTPQRVVALLKRCQEAGINTWQNSYDRRPLDDLERFREAG